MLNTFEEMGNYLISKGFKTDDYFRKYTLESSTGVIHVEFITNPLHVSISRQSRVGDKWISNSYKYTRVYSISEIEDFISCKPDDLFMNLNEIEAFMEQSRQNRYQAERLRVSEAIRSACEKGKRQVSIDDIEFDHNLSKELSALGYQIAFFGCGMKISWDQQNRRF